jgi:ATP-dependent Lon protease
LLYPHAEYDKEAVRDCLTYALEVRRRVKEQLKKIGGMEFFDVNFSYIDNETLEEFFVNVPEQGGADLIPRGLQKPGVIHFVSGGALGKLGVYRLETQMTAGNGKHSTSGLGSDTSAKEQVRVGFEYFKGNLNRIAANTKFSEHEFHLHFVDLQNSGNSHSASLASLVACCSILMNKPLQEAMVVLGSMTLGGVVNPVQDLASSMQVALEAGATKALLPMASASDIASVPGETFTKFQVSFYSDPVDAVYKALGVS